MWHEDVRDLARELYIQALSGNVFYNAVLAERAFVESWDAAERFLYFEKGKRENLSHESQKTSDS